MASKSDRKTILIIEDEPTIMTFASRLLEIGGHRVLQADNGTEGLRMIREESVDLVLLDLMIPDPDGWAILEHMKSDPRLSAIPVVVFSAFAEPGKIEAAKEMGVVEYLVKPLSASRLRQTVEAILRGWSGD